MFKDFKEFAIKGNLISMSVGVIVGGAFSKIVTSLVNDMLMPLLGLLLGGVDLTGFAWEVAPVFGGEGAVIRYGAFLQSVVDFLIIAFSIFFFMRMVTKLFERNKKEQEAAPPAKSDEVALLEEIRDLLKNDAKTE